jgi:hypothetical protein
VVLSHILTAQAAGKPGVPGFILPSCPPPKTLNGGLGATSRILARPSSPPCTFQPPALQDPLCPLARINKIKIKRKLCHVCSHDAHMMLTQLSTPSSGQQACTSPQQENKEKHANVPKPPSPPIPSYYTCCIHILLLMPTMSTLDYCLKACIASIFCHPTQ